jgi:hypothetical protein
VLEQASEPISSLGSSELRKEAPKQVLANEFI